MSSKSYESLPPLRYLPWPTCLSIRAWAARPSRVQSQMQSNPPGGEALWHRVQRPKADDGDDDEAATYRVTQGRRQDYHDDGWPKDPSPGVRSWWFGCRMAVQFDTAKKPAKPKWNRGSCRGSSVRENALPRPKEWSCLLHDLSISITSYPRVNNWEDRGGGTVEVEWIQSAHVSRQSASRPKRTDLQFLESSIKRGFLGLGPLNVFFSHFG